mmetsp:Transcript_28511/g.69383  ORF Transcript_28511/g.69383 Transcript_28511/m.69383 type:complete len:106 (+) Transcript_28511:581-898(+)
MTGSNIMVGRNFQNYNNVPRLLQDTRKRIGGTDRTISRRRSGRISRKMRNKAWQSSVGPNMNGTNTRSLQSTFGYSFISNEVVNAVTKKIPIRISYHTPMDNEFV